MNLPNVWKLSLVPALLLSQAAFAQNKPTAVRPAGSLKPGQVRPYVWLMTGNAPAGHGPGQTNAQCMANGCYYFPVDIRTAYTTSGIANGNGGAGMTVGIVDAFYNSQTEADLAAFSTAFSLPACSIASGCLTIVGQTGAAPTATLDSGWAVETNLDVQWVHAIAPNAKILLVTATDNSDNNMWAAVGYAMLHSNVVTNSWGEEEFSGQNTYDDIAAGSTVPLLFSAGDQGALVQFPCASPNVTCVGGTRLIETASSYRSVESVWGDTFQGDEGTGGGCSAVESKPTYQVGFTESVCGTNRGVPDIAGIADPNTGVLVYFGSNVCGGFGSEPPEPHCTPNGFYDVGGTSAASPISAAYIATVDTARAAAQRPPLGAGLNSLLYQSVAAPFYHYRFFDITSGSSGFAATAGWDRATGLGVPLGPALATFLVAQ